MESVRDAIVAANQKFMVAFKQGDAAAVAALYTPDANLMPPDHQMMSGAQAIRAFWQGAMSSGIKEAQLETMEVEARDDLAYEIGKFALTIEPASGERMTMTGKYVVVWKKQNGDWKLHVDIWNGDASAERQR